MIDSRGAWNDCWTGNIGGTLEHYIDGLNG